MTSQDLKLIAARLGLEECRIATVAGPAPYAERMDAWLAAGEYGDMDWVAERPHRRRDPREVLPGVRSMVVIAQNYYQHDPASVATGTRGRIARYAWGDDYHAIMDRKLQDMCECMAAAGGSQRLYVDTGPVLERSWATAAGLGWNGKSTIQIHRELGAWFFLGEILTTLPLEPDPPAPAHCGTCTRCITACPTGAITAPHHVDARRCISYLTIEHRGPIPMEFREAIGDRIYGCDDCLAACPWNRFAQASRETGFAARSFVHGWLLREFLALDDAAFRTLFRWSPIKRIKRPAFLRNVCVALGNTGTTEDLPALHIAAADPDPLIAEHAAWAIVRISERHPGPTDSPARAGKTNAPPA